MIIGGYPRPSALLRFGVGLSRAPLRCGAAHSSRWSLPSYPLATLTPAPPTASSATSPRLQLRTSRRPAALPAPQTTAPAPAAVPLRRYLAAQGFGLHSSARTPATRRPLLRSPASRPSPRRTETTVATEPAGTTSRTAAPPRRARKAPRRASAPPKAGAGRRLKKPAARVVKLAFRPRRHRSKARCAAHPLGRPPSPRDMLRFALHRLGFRR